MLYSLIHIILNNIFLFRYFNQYLPLIELKKKFIIVERKKNEKDEDKKHVTITSSWWWFLSVLCVWGSFRIILSVCLDVKKIVMKRKNFYTCRITLNYQFYHLIFLKCWKWVFSSTHPVSSQIERVWNLNKWIRGKFEFFFLKPRLVRGRFRYCLVSS